MGTAEDNAIERIADNRLPLRGHLEHMRCPFLVMHGGHDVLTVSQARKVYDYARGRGLDVALRLLSAEETGAEHCQHDNPTLGQEILADWLADRFGIDQGKLRAHARAAPA